jgi:hypothetical protein
MNFVFINFLNVIKMKNLKNPRKNIKILNFQIKFDSKYQILIPFSSFFLTFDQMDGTWSIWSHYPIDSIIWDPIKRSLLYYHSQVLKLLSWMSTFFLFIWENINLLKIERQKDRKTERQKDRKRGVNTYYLFKVTHKHYCYHFQVLKLLSFMVLLNFFG